MDLKLQEVGGRVLNLDLSISGKAQPLSLLSRRHNTHNFI
jgi:hypothetical protein